ncbi:MAG: coproporphyrinogen III oxidase family protein, partial [Ruminococcus sp.]|nr:coproporphyrinogen III oxidase family protein [Ruminococcus sp.]
HVSAYILKTEKGTPFECDEIKNSLPDDDTPDELYIATAEFLKKSDFIQYEVSNFAKKGFESRHNCRYWRCLDYIGIGVSAHSCYGGKRFAVDRNLDDFISREVQKVEITDESPCGFEEYSMLRLRLSEGLDVDVFPEHKSRILKKIPELIKSGYVKYENNKISLTPRGFIVSNAIIEYLVF